MDQNHLHPNPPPKSSGFLRELFSWLRTIAVSIVLALLISFFVIANAAVASGSMENTIMTGERVTCLRLAYRFADPERYDIILFRYPYGPEPINYVKRIIGLPGETVEIIDGKVYINGSNQPLSDSFTQEIPTGDYGPFEVPEDHYFVLGDNRNNSFDSKSWENPYLPRDTIIGKALFSYYPTFKLHGDVE